MGLDSVFTCAYFCSMREDGTECSCNQHLGLQPVCWYLLQYMCLSPTSGVLPFSSFPFFLFLTNQIACLRYGTVGQRQTNGPLLKRQGSREKGASDEVKAERKEQLTLVCFILLLYNFFISNPFLSSHTTTAILLYRHDCSRAQYQCLTYWHA